MFQWLKNLFARTQTTSKKEKILSSIISFGYIFLLGYGGSSRPDAFYAALKKPAAVPPNWVFPIAWTILFVLIGLAGFYVWNHYESNFKRKLFAFFYAINGILVYLWSYLFFGLHDINTPLYVIIGMIIVAELMIVTAFGTNRKAAYLLLPYLAWILFATYLNSSIILLNA
jgi:benzodiazapine receptor